MQLLILHMHTLLSEFERKNNCNPAVSKFAVHYSVHYSGGLDEVHKFRAGPH